MSLLVASVVLLWVVVLVLVVLVILVYRQFGLIYLGSGRSVRIPGVQVGHHAPEHLTVAVDGELVPVDWTAPGEGRGTMVLFGAPDCPLCERIVPMLNHFASEWRHTVDLLFVDRFAADRFISRPLPIDRGWTYAISAGGAFHEAFDIQATPYCYVVNAKGVVQAREIVNTIESMHTLLIGALDPDKGFRVMKEQDAAFELVTIDPRPGGAARSEEGDHGRN